LLHELRRFEAATQFGHSRSIRHCRAEDRLVVECSTGAA
jgi:hypothetical protein